VVLHVTALLIVLGGLSPMVVASLPNFFRSRRTRTPLQVRIALNATFVLLAVSFLGISSMEWTNTLAPLAWPDRLHNAWFQAVTLRTAGFNSVNIAAMHPSTLVLMMMMMFIGGCPGGTAGGIKTTTAAVLFLTVSATVRRRDAVIVYGREISRRTISRATAIALVATAIVFVALMAMLLTQSVSGRMALFEVISAFGTVGLSIGATVSLDAVGKWIIILCMFVGRVGTLTLFMFLSSQVAPSVWKQPKEDIDVG
jgi:trk system potassium uptake protein TrkH